MIGCLKCGIITWKQARNLTDWMEQVRNFKITAGVRVKNKLTALLAKFAMRRPLLTKTCRKILEL